MTVAPWTPAQTQLFRLVVERAPAEGWRATRRDDGFDLDRDLTRETRATESSATPEWTRWRHLAHEVRFAPDGSYVVTDVDRRASLDVRGPDVGPRRSVERGRKVGGGSSMTFKLVDGRLRRIDDNRYDLSAGRTLVEREAEAAGLERHRARPGWEAKVGLAVAAVAISGLLAGGVVLLAIALVG